MYCGDETGSFIGDVGSHTCRFGYGGEDNPKYVAPSYMAATEEHSDGYIPSSCYQGRLAAQTVQPMLRTPWLGGGDDTNHNKLMAAPQIDPNAYLQQGDMIQDWDALERIWQTSFDVCRVRDTKKHTKGGTSYLNSSQAAATGGESASTTTTAEGKVQSTTVRASDTTSNNEGSGKCVHPILAVTPGLTHTMGAGNGLKYAAAIQRDQHTRLTEFFMETMEAPAVFLAPTPMLSSFCFGRQTSLVVDVGAGGCRVTPVVDGLVLKHAQRRNGRGGDWLGNVQWRALADDKIVLRPRYQLRNNVSAMATKSPYLYRWAMQDLMYEMRTSSHIKLTQWCMDASVPFLAPPKSTTAGASSPSGSSKASSDGEDNDNDDDGTGEADSDAMEVDDDAAAAAAVPVSPAAAELNPAAAYELPDGTCVDMSSKTGTDLCRIPELLFTDDVPYVGDTANGSMVPAGILGEHHTLSNLPLHKLIFESLTAVGDGDIRKDLANNIILTGGSSLFPNLEQRLSLEVPRLVPSAYKCRVVASRNSVERSCSAFVGASILTSLGSFQQLWLSRTEYEEYGTTLSVQRFP